MSYIPPHLRRAAAEQSASANKNTELSQSSHTSDTDRPKLYQVSDIHEHYWPLTDGPERPSFASAGTLNGSSATPDKLAYVMLYHQANPLWESDGVIFAKSSLGLLPGGKSHANERDRKNTGWRQWRLDGKPLTCKDSKDSAIGPATETVSDGVDPEQELYEVQEPIAVFEQGGRRMIGLEFIGYYRLVGLQFFEPKSEELVQMLMRKWSIRDGNGREKKIERSSADWQKSLALTWAEVKLQKDEELTKQRAPPEIKTLQENEDLVPKKSVNELLKEMRLGRDEKEKTTEDTTSPPSNE